MLELNKVYNEDCLLGFQKLEDNSIDCIWTDPPFNVGYKYNKYKDRLEREDYKNFMGRVMLQCYRVLKEGKFLFVKQTYRNLDLMIDIRYNFKLHNLIVWKNSNTDQPKNNYKTQYEVILMFLKGKEPDYFNPNFETKKTVLPFEAGGGINLNGKLTNLWLDIPNLYAGAIIHPEAVIKEGTKSKAHPAQHPKQLVKRCIGFVTKENDIVLDCFIGSGTTAVACKELNRNFIGFEIDKTYCQIAEERLKQQIITDYTGGT